MVGEFYILASNLFFIKHMERAGAWEFGYRTVNSVDVGRIVKLVSGYSFACDRLVKVKVT